MDFAEDYKELEYINCKSEVLKEEMSLCNNNLKELLKSWKLENIFTHLVGKFLPYTKLWVVVVLLHFGLFCLYNRNNKYESVAINMCKNIQRCHIV